MHCANQIHGFAMSFKIKHYRTNTARTVEVRGVPTEWKDRLDRMHSWVNICSLLA